MQLTRQPSQFPKDVKDDVLRAINQMWVLLTQVINGKIAFGTPASGPDNIDGVFFTTLTPAGADTDFTFNTKLGRVPTGWITISVDKGAVIYKGSVAWTTTQMTLKCNVASVNIIIFIF